MPGSDTCDVVGCFAPAAVWIHEPGSQEGIPHCWGCLELVWDRWLAAEIDRGVLEHIVPIRYRYRPTRDYGPPATFELPPEDDPPPAVPIGPVQAVLELGILEREAGELNP